MSLDPITAGVDLVTSLVNRFVPVPLDQNAKAKLDADLQAAKDSGELQIILGQLQINQEEAKNPNWFIAGARPAAMWVCVGGMFYQFIFYPIASAFIPHLALLDANTIMGMLSGLLGLGVFRTVEKVKGAEGNRT